MELRHLKGAHPNSVVYRDLPARAGLEAPITLAWRKAELEGATATFVQLARRIAAPAARRG